eukprot:1160988-Pelagomonas_calceolata.AAC.4
MLAWADAAAAARASMSWSGMSIRCHCCRQGIRELVGQEHQTHLANVGLGRCRSCGQGIHEVVGQEHQILANHGDVGQRSGTEAGHRSNCEAGSTNTGSVRKQRCQEKRWCAKGDAQKKRKAALELGIGATVKQAAQTQELGHALQQTK